MFQLIVDKKYRANERLFCTFWRGHDIVLSIKKQIVNIELLTD